MFDDETACASRSFSDGGNVSTYSSMKGRERILVVEDDDALRAMLVGFFTKHGFRALEAADGNQALKKVFTEKPSLIVLDVNMPALGGLAVLARVRKAGLDLPILMLSGRGGVQQRIEGLTLGADDYLAKPFDFEEMLARVRALFRRHTRTATPRYLQLGDTTVDLVNMTARAGAISVTLSRTECSILDVLARSAGQPVTRERMLDVVWGYTYLPNTRTVDTHVWRLRKKLCDAGAGGEPRWIKNVPGVGYRLETS